MPSQGFHHDSHRPGVQELNLVGMVEAAGFRSAAQDLGEVIQVVEAAGIEPVLPLNPNLLMARDFGCYDVKTIELPRRFESPGVLPSLGDILETRRGALSPTPGRCFSPGSTTRSHWYVLLAEA